MKTLNIYVARSFLVTFAMAMGILTFGLLGARLVKIFEFLSRGVPVSVAGTFILYILPVILTMTIPWATLVAVMLVFGRLSADTEITAMRACGVSILQIVSPIIVFAMMLSGFCLFLQSDIGPGYLGKARNLVQDVGVNQPLALLEPGWPIEFDNTYIYIDDRVGENDIKDIQIYRMDPESKRVNQDISAASGKVLADKDKQTITIELYDCIIKVFDEDQPRRSSMKKFAFTFNYGEEFNRGEITKRVKYMSFKELFGRFRIYNENNIDTTHLEVEINQRIAFALAPIAFVLLGLPLAIRTSRRETSIGLFLSVILMGVYFMSIIICDSLTNYPRLYPQYMLWIPVVLFQAAGIVMIVRIVRR